MPHSDCAYYQRKIQPTRLTQQDAMSQYRVELQRIIREFYPGLDVANSRQVLAKIHDLKKLGVSIARSQSKLQQEMTILEDLHHILASEKVVISEDSQPYYTLGGGVGGVTEKISLVSESSIRQKLEALQKVKSLDGYNHGRSELKLSTEAIIKLPKHGDPLEVQREAMALGISRLLGLETTRSTMLSYRGKPALFVPFDDIRLLSEVTTGKTMQARLGSTKTYTHYSTLNAVGEGFELPGSHTVESLGKALGLLYLCSDTDSIGGYAQNKALKGNRLFIFDQVISKSSKLGLDSRLSMQPIKFLTRHTRHDQGRNRTLVEDASLQDKFDSLMQLKNQEAHIISYFSDIISEHTQEIHRLRRKGAPPSDIEMLEALRSDASALLTAVKERISAIDSVMPKHKPAITDSLLLKTLSLEKVLNSPTSK